MAPIIGSHAPSEILTRCTVTCLYLRFPRNHQIHRREQLLLRPRHQAIRRQRQAIRRLLRPLRHQPYRLQGPNRVMRHRPPHLRHPRNGYHVAHTPRHPQIPIQRVIPRSRVRPVRQVLVHLELEPCGLNGAQAFGDGDHVGDAVALLDAEADLAVARVGIVVRVGHEPFVDAKDAARFEDAEDLRVDTLQGGGVHGGFDGVDGVEGIVREGHLLVTGIRR